jgi:hypothetical protein
LVITANLQFSHTGKIAYYRTNPRQEAIEVCRQGRSEAKPEGSP